MTQKCIKILIAGGFDREDPNALDRPVTDLVAFGQELAREILRQGHKLLTGAQTELDKEIAGAAMALVLKKEGEQPEPRVISYVPRGKTPVHDHGVIIQSDLSDWDIGGLEPTAPEVIRYSDVVILLGGFAGTLQAANWARLSRKPILPFASFGGTAKDVYTIESRRFEEVYAASIQRLEYEQVLKSVSKDWEKLAKSTVGLAEKVITTPSVFVIMSFAETGQYKDLYASIQRVCEKYDYDALRVDESNLLKRIIPEIMRQVRQSAFVVADVTEAKPNVFYELGFADGLGKEVILTAKAGTKLPFDIQDIPVLFWESFVEFEEQLEKRVAQIGQWQGRA